MNVVNNYDAAIRDLCKNMQPKNLTGSDKLHVIKSRDLIAKATARKLPASDDI